MLLPFYAGNIGENLITQTSVPGEGAFGGKRSITNGNYLPDGMLALSGTPNVPASPDLRS